MASAAVRSVARYQAIGTLGPDVIPSEIHPARLVLYDLIRVQNAHYGSLIRAAHEEPFMTQGDCTGGRRRDDARAVDLTRHVTRACDASERRVLARWPRVHSDAASYLEAG